MAGDAVAADGAALASGSRVVLQPVLGCEARGIVPPCPACQAGHVGNCGYLAFGHVRPGLQTGFCADTGGGWSTSGLVAHGSQLFAVPDGLDDADAVTIEPLACAVHAVLGAPIAEGDVVAVLGAGTLGLLVVAALTHLASDGALRHAVGTAGRSTVRAPGAPRPRVRRHRGAAPRPAPAGRAPPLALAVVRRGRRHDGDVVGRGRRGHRLRRQRRVDRAVPGHRAPARDRRPRRHARPGDRRPGAAVAPRGPPGRRLRLRDRAGPHRGGPGTSTFALAFEVAAAQRTGRLVSATYPLTRFEDAVAHAGAAGRRGAVKIAFDLGKGHAR